MNSKRQRGVALIVVLLVVAMVTIVATEMTTRLQLNIGKVNAIKDNNQAYWFSMGAEQLAIRVLTQQIALDNDVFHLQQPWAQKEFNYPIPNGSISGQLSDMRTCYNLNALAVKPDAGQPFQQREVFETLLQEIEWEVSSLDRDT